MRELVDVFAEAVGVLGIVAAVGHVLYCAWYALYCVGEYVVETAYEKHYGARNWEEKWQEHKEEIKDAMKVAGYAAAFGAGTLFAKFAAGWFVASVYRLGAGG